ncbi:sensor histidine kinase [Arthrobacter sp. NEB 688]|uniref:sensor histidine kinase n=1 Tax=Arthrobacter sp. NEB 688 TaxID=904039 RepID=UPI001564806B|nr:sensor histidine kinase [Arthrobacter sp. NEB 688]QKE84084.1 sensor histidine kinase [Arthrobacter sp. NEB 688]
MSAQPSTPTLTEAPDLGALLVDAVTVVAAAACRRSLLFTVDLDDEPLDLALPSAAWHDLVVSVLARAVATLPPGTEVALSLTRRAGLLTLRLSDTGPGVAPAASDGGITREAVEALGGGLEVTAVAGVGNVVGLTWSGGARGRHLTAV